MVRKGNSPVVADAIQHGLRHDLMPNAAARIPVQELNHRPTMLG